MPKQIKHYHKYKIVTYSDNDDKVTVMEKNWWTIYFEINTRFSYIDLKYLNLYAYKTICKYNFFILIIFN